jgi:PleD family two-component response regulator
MRENGILQEAGNKIVSDVLQRKKVLVIDDDPFTLELLRKMLRSICNVVTATNGADGLEIIETSDIDLVLLDWMMPEMDGISVLINLMSNEETKDVPVLFISSKTDQTSIDRALSVGAKDYITKPFHKKDLINTVQEHL